MQVHSNFAVLISFSSSLLTTHLSLHNFLCKDLIIPDAVLINILTFIPEFSFLQIAQVSKTFRLAWLEMKKRSSPGNEFKTDPLLIGNLFSSYWSVSAGNMNCLNKTLLKYYVDNGYGKNSSVLKKIMLNIASRGDISAMHFMATEQYCSLDDEEICTMAGAAGKLEALKWLRGDIRNNKYLVNGIQIICPWNPTEVHREAAENAHDDVLEYVEKNSESHQIQTSYGVGLPW